MSRRLVTTTDDGGCLFVVEAADGPKSVSIQRRANGKLRVFYDGRATKGRRRNQLVRHALACGWRPTS